MEQLTDAKFTVEESQEHETVLIYCEGIGFRASTCTSN